jgi:hypothetical protein
MLKISLRCRRKKCTASSAITTSRTTTAHSGMSRIVCIILPMHVVYRTYHNTLFTVANIQMFVFEHGHLPADGVHTGSTIRSPSCNGPSPLRAISRNGTWACAAPKPVR